MGWVPEGAVPDPVLDAEPDRGAVSDIGEVPDLGAVPDVGPVPDIGAVAGPSSDPLNGPSADLKSPLVGASGAEGPV